MANPAFHQSRQNEINFRATRLVGLSISEKVGFIQSDSAAGRLVQAMGSLALPGDLSDIRRPIRSTLYEALTPGGGGGRGLGSTIGPVQRALRCPTGFEFGGRYATRGFGNCGRQLFEIPTPADGGAGPAFPTINRSFGMVGLIKPESRRVLGLGNDIRSIQIQRNASIPRIGARNESRAATALDTVIEGISSSTDNQRFMIRGDGFVLKPSIDSDSLRKIRKNPDMDGATFVVNAPNPLKMADEEVPLLWNSNLGKVVVALPGGGSLSLERSGDLSMGQKRRLTRIWQQSEASDKLNAGERLRTLAEASDGKIKYTEKIGSNKPNEMITIEDSNGKISATRRWIFDSYLSESAPGRGKNKPLKEVPSDSDSTSVDNSIESEKEALDALKNGARLEDIPSKYLGSAINDKEVFDRRSVRPGVSRLQDREGRVYYDIDGKKDFGAVTARTASDIRAVAGLPSGNVKFNGDGVRRGIIVPDSENIAGARVNRSGGLSSIDPDQIVRLAATDYLLDETNRNPSSINALDLNGKKLAYVLPSIDPKSAGLSAEELDERRRAVLGDFYSTDNVYSQALSRISRSRKRQLNSVLDDILKRLEAFNWDEYQTSLGLDGDLSPAEKRHIEILKSLFRIRLSRIKSSKKMFLNVIGATSGEEKTRLDLIEEEYKVKGEFDLFFLDQSEKGIGEAIGRGVSRARRALGRFDPNAEDGDGDQVVQEGTQWERPAPKKRNPVSKLKKRREAARKRRAIEGIVRPPVTQSSGDRYDENWYTDVWPELRRRGWDEAREPVNRRIARQAEEEFDKKYPRPESPEYDRDQFIADLEATDLGDMDIDYRLATFDRLRRERIQIEQDWAEGKFRKKKELIWEECDETITVDDDKVEEADSIASSEKLNSKKPISSVKIEEKGIGDNLRNLARGAGGAARRGIMRRLDQAANRMMTGMDPRDGDGDGFYSRRPGDPDNTPVPRRAFGPRLGLRNEQGNLQELPGTPYQNANRIRTGREQARERIRQQARNTQGRKPRRRVLRPEDIGEDDIWDDNYVPPRPDENSDDIWGDDDDLTLRLREFLEERDTPGPGVRPSEFLRGDPDDIWADTQGPRDDATWIGEDDIWGERPEPTGPRTPPRRRRRPPARESRETGELLPGDPDDLWD